VGINSGDVNVGFLGSRKRKIEYTVIGDTVNTAARLVSKATPGQIVVSEETMMLLGDRFQTRELGAMQLKGKAAPVNVYEVVY
jgi:adenylate cyclase